MSPELEKTLDRLAEGLCTGCGSSDIKFVPPDDDEVIPSTAICNDCGHRMTVLE